MPRAFRELRLERSYQWVVTRLGAVFNSSVQRCVQSLRRSVFG